MKALQTNEAEFYDIIPGDEIIYPESDGQPMAENTVQYRWIVKIKEGLESMFADDPDVFVAADLFWYPIEGDRYTKYAPDVMAAFGRPKGDRGSYIQYKEGNIPPQVVFEILSPGNTDEEMEKKFDFYEQHGVEEYYVYDPDNIILKGWVRLGKRLRPVKKIAGWLSPRMKIRFEINEELAIFRPDGRKFLTPLETEQQFISEKTRAEQEKTRADNAEKLAETERKNAETERKNTEIERKNARRLAEKLRELGIDPENLIQENGV